jgi:hypothetical protein
MYTPTGGRWMDKAVYEDALATSVCTMKIGDRRYTNLRIMMKTSSWF